MYVGRKIQNGGVATGFLQDALDRITSEPSGSTLSKRTVSQICGGELNSNNHLGVVVDPQGDLAWVQKATRSWAEARCVDESSSEAFESSVQFGSNIPVVRQSPLPKRRAPFRPSNCERIQAAHGDTIESLASVCGITTKELTKLNSLPDDWEPHPYQWVCCSPGLRKRAAPSPRPDGTCVSYIVQNLDTCYSISTSYDITQADLYTFNKQMWGWGGCNNLFPGMRICVGALLASLRLTRTPYASQLSLGPVPPPLAKRSRTSAPAPSRHAVTFGATAASTKTFVCLLSPKLATRAPPRQTPTGACRTAAWIL